MATPLCLLAVALLSAPPPATPLTVVALGDSTTAGTPFFRSPVEAPPDGEGDATAPFTYWMMKARPAWTVLNRGVNGERTDEIQARFEHDVLEARPQRPQVMILLGGVNDVYQGVPLELTQQELSSMLRKARARGIIPVAATVLPFTLATPAQSAAIRRVNEWLKEKTQSEQMVLCDLHAVVADPEHPDRLKGSPEGLHPDRAGYKAMGEALVGCVERAMRENAERAR